MAHPHAAAPSASIKKQISLVGGSVETQSKDNPYAKDKKKGGGKGEEKKREKGEKIKRYKNPAGNRRKFTKANE